MNSRRILEIGSATTLGAVLTLGFLRGEAVGELGVRASVLPSSVLSAPPPAAGARRSDEGGPEVRHLQAPGTSSGLPFSAAVIAGDTIHLAGTLGLEPGTRKVPTDPKREARLAMNNFKSRVELAGATMADVVSVKVFCSDPSLYDSFNEVYRTYFEEGQYPARAFIITAPCSLGPTSRSPASPTSASERLDMRSG